MGLGKEMLQMSVDCIKAAREHPKVSRELHKRNCHCNVCFPNEKQKNGDMK